MKHEPHTEERSPAIDTPEAATETVEELLSSFPMKGAVSIPRSLSRGLVILCATLLVTLLAGAILLAFGGASFWIMPTLPPAGTEEETSVKPEDGPPDATYPYADGKGGHFLLTLPADSTTVDASMLDSSHAVVADVTSGVVLASRLGDELMYPASMTKVMTLIVAVERLPYDKSLQDTVTISQEVHDRMVAEGSSGIGFQPGMKLTVEALLYALMLQSDGMAACELANYIAGSEAEFVRLMNQKAADMGLSATHFENCTGLNHPRHQSTAREMASIMAYAMNMKLCRKVMTTELFRTPVTMADGEVQTYGFYNALLVHQFEKNPVHQPKTMDVIAGKTGYTPESRYCLVTYAETADGRGYVCVTADAANYAACIADYIKLYDTCIKP